MSDYASRHTGYKGSLNYRTEVDATKVNELLTQLSSKNALKGVKAGLRKSVSVIRKQARQNLSASVPGAKSSTHGKALEKEINLAVYRNASGARVDLLDKRRKGSRAFVLKFFEWGTVQRSTKGRGRYKRSANRGTIPAVGFFQQAVSSKKQEAESLLESNILEQLKKVVEKNK